MRFLEKLASRRRFGMKPGLDSIRALCKALGNPERRFGAIHVAGTNGKGAVCAMVDAALRSSGFRVGRYTSPHLVRLNERFFLNGHPVDDGTLETVAERVEGAMSFRAAPFVRDLTFFEALTAVAFELFADSNVDYAVLECGLGGRLDATNVCQPLVSVITRIGLDHCDWLGNTVEEIAAEKSGIVKPDVPIVLGKNTTTVRAVVERRAAELGAPFHYAPDLADEAEIPVGFPLPGSFNRENAVTALATLRVLSPGLSLSGSVVWPGRFQRVGRHIVDGAHNPPAARALAEALRALPVAPHSLSLVAGFCADKDVDEVLSILSPLVRRGFAVKTTNPRSLSAIETASKMRDAGIAATASASLAEALAASEGETLVCGSLFLAGEALVALGAYPWEGGRFDPAEILKV